MDDLISVIVTVYNSEKNLKDCIFSIIGQTYRNMEIIIVDDGSTDGSSKICDELLISNSRMKVTHQLHLGLSNTRNKGLQMASGKFVTFVNGSDVIDKNMLSNLFYMMNNYSVEIAMCATYTDVKKNESDTVITFDREDTMRQLLIEKLISNTPYGKLFIKNLFNYVNFSDDEADTLFKLIEYSSKVAFMNIYSYNIKNKEPFSFNLSLSKDLRLMKKYPNLSLYCKCNIVKSIQNEFYDSITNNKPIIDEDKLYLMFMQIVKENDDEILHFFSYIRRAHIYLLANDKNNYRMICPVLPDLYQEDEE